MHDYWYNYQCGYHYFPFNIIPHVTTITEEDLGPYHATNKAESTLLIATSTAIDSLSYDITTYMSVSGGRFWSKHGYQYSYL